MGLRVVMVHGDWELTMSLHDENAYGMDVILIFYFLQPLLLFGEILTHQTDRFV